MNTSKSLRIHNEYLSGLKENPHIQNRTRMFSIGATDTSAILGLNKYKSPYALWLEKTGRVQPEDISMKWPVRIGKASEEMISSIYEEDFDVFVDDPGEMAISMPGSPWMSCTPDRIVNLKMDRDEGEWNRLPNSKKQRGLEIKTGRLTSQWGEEFTEEVPDSYYIQCMQCMMIHDLDRWDVAAELYDNSIEIRYYTINYSKEVADIIESRVYNFWFNHIIKDVPPEEKDFRDIKLVKSEEGKTCIINESINSKLERLLSLKSDKKMISNQIEEIEFHIKDYMNDSEILLDEDGERRATWKSQAHKSMDVNGFRKDYSELYSRYARESEKRVFRVK